MKVAQDPRNEVAAARTDDFYQIQFDEPSLEISVEAPKHAQGRFRDLVSGKKRGRCADLARGGLRFLAWVYGWVVRLRNKGFDRGLLKTRRVPIPVFSVGNLSTGGTGKTPFVIWLAQRLGERQTSPTILIRGYQRGGSAEIHDPDSSDEVSILRRRLSGVTVLAGADRVATGEQAVREGAQALVLDDGFQHRRLARDLDIVLVDATCPFGYGYLLPRGLLREPFAGLSRAGAFVLTRSDQVPSDERRRIREVLERVAAGRPVVEAVHRPVEVCSVSTKQTFSTKALAGRRVLLVAGVGNPSSFLATVASLGAKIVGTVFYPDHYVFKAADTSWIRYKFVHTGAELVVTTEKDVARGDELIWAGVETVYLRIEFEITSGESELLAAVDCVLDKPSSG